MPYFGGGGAGVVTSLGTPAVNNTITLNNNSGSPGSVILLDGTNHQEIGVNASDAFIGGVNSQVIRFDGFNAKLGFFGSAGGTKQTVTGAKGANAALGSLIAALVAHGMITDTTTA